MVLFQEVIDTLLKENENYRLPNHKGHSVTNKNHNVYKAVVRQIPSILKERLKELKLENIEFINIEGSTGDGLLSESYWIAFLDERVTTSTRNGIYIVLLFDNTLENVYLTIGSGTENFGLRQIRQEAAERRKIFQEQISKNQKYKEFSTGDIFLGVKPRARKFAASVCIYKKYITESINFDVLINDIVILNDLYYKYLFEDFMIEPSGSENKEADEDGNEHKKTKKRIINKDKYRQLRLDRDERNKKTGDIAEEFVYNLEKEKLSQLGLHELAGKVDWVAQREDGHGYDIVSFFPDGSKKFIEVKGSTLAHDNFTFYLSYTEKWVAEDLKDAYVLTLVQNVGSEEISIYNEIADPINQLNELEPTHFKGVIKRV